ncbi:hypothetical protein EDD85DRAFT_938665 [Armillaria nabsnona]|nr:hypothetical protein EDD85DRAFT_938665 [Armillaria nabsnona]
MQGFLPERIVSDVEFLFRDGFNTFESLAVTVLKRFEPFTSAAVLLVQRLSDNEKAILKLANRRLGYRSGKGGPMPWSPSSKIICNTSYAKFRRAWHLTGSSLYAMTRTNSMSSFGRIGRRRSPLGVTSYRTTTRYHLLHQLQDRYIPRLFGVVRLRITPESTTVHPITDVVQGLVFEYIPGISMAKLKSGVDVSEQEAEQISSQVMEALCAIDAENCVLHNDMHIENVVLRDGGRSPVIIDFGQADIRQPELYETRVLSGSLQTRVT